MPANNSRVWLSEELSTFLAIIGDGVIQSELDGSVRNEKVYKDISQRMAAEGFERTSGQCRAKLKKLKAQYKKIKDANSRSGNCPTAWRWYDAMDAIYGHRPANQGREGGLDSATVILESMVDPFETVDGLSTDASNLSEDGPSMSFSSNSSSISSSQPQSSQPQSSQLQSTPNAPRHNGERRRLQLDLRTVMEDMRAAEERQLERMDNLSERRFQAVRQDAQEAMRQEAEIARQQMEQLATFNQAFLGVLGQLVQVIGANRQPRSPPRH
ncbi:zinc finger and SCAN domain-containing protein 29-like [Bufo bufo]|uniref:zinc finger and SCAN domain-containing protein 29-like n=1 Tax=Bufo bufo TaxID=8384 RepID=UPI001ABE45BC|nr:zinc finger and SCAN domain-containing protein 29-like [Bufo bufo]